MHFSLQLPVPPVSVKEVVFDSAVSDIQVRQGPGWWFLWWWWHMIFAPWIGFKSLRTSCVFFDLGNFSTHICSHLSWFETAEFWFTRQGFWSSWNNLLTASITAQASASREIPPLPVAGRRSKDGHHPDHQGVRILAAYQPWSAVVVKTALPKILKDLWRWPLEYVAFFCLAHAWWTECWWQFGGSSLSDTF